MDGGREVDSWVCGAASLLVMPLGFAAMREGKGSSFPRQGPCFCLSYTAGHSVRVPALLFNHYCITGPQWCLYPLPLSFSQPAFPTPSNIPTFSYANAWIFQVCLCVEHRNLCWIIVVQLVVNLRGGSKRYCHSAMMLMFQRLFET